MTKKKRMKPGKGFVNPFPDLTTIAVCHTAIVISWNVAVLLKSLEQTSLRSKSGARQPNLARK